MTLDLLPRVLFRDSRIIILDKPAGIAVHKGPANKPSLEDYFGQLRFGLPRLPALAHRLDADTSGCLVLGRHPKALRRLGRLFSQGQVSKTYLAITKVRPSPQTGRISLPLLKTSTREDGWRMVVDPAGKPSVTDYKLLASREEFHLVKLTPLTGRTHQLRVHLSEMCWPIFGEPRYAKLGNPALPLCLHSWKISIPLYADSEQVTACAPLPPHFEKFAQIEPEPDLL